MTADAVVPGVVAFAKEFAASGDLERFRDRVLDRYTEGTLVRLLESSRDLATRRAAVLALGVVGSFACNAAVAAALRDDDTTLRHLAEHGIWAIWFRADTPANNARLRRVSRLIADGELVRAVKLVRSLIERAPRFAEVYNQRAIAYWLMKRWRKSIADCKKVLELNPHHFGALSGMGQCYIQLGDWEHAIEALKRAMEINRNLEHLGALVGQLRSRLDS